MLTAPDMRHACARVRSGGVPVCFPQFGMMGPMATQHGFARNVTFSIEARDDWSVTMVRGKTST